MSALAEAPPEAALGACAVCGASDSAVRYQGCRDRLHWLEGRFDVVRCSECGLGWTTPRPGDLAAYYPASYISFESAGAGPGPAWLKQAVRFPYERRYGREARIPQPPRPGSRALDVGSGAGGYLRELARAGWEPFGIEPSAEAAAKSPGRVFVGTLEEADFPAESFDLVTMSHVLEHVPSPLAALARIRRWLRPGGKLRIWVPNFESFEARAFGRLWFGLDVPRHLLHFSPGSLRLALERSGFEVERLVPEFEASSLSGSLAHLGSALRRRRLPYRHVPALYYGAFPVAALLRAAGAAACLDCTARRVG